jgi:hypothetical protein
MMPLSTYLQTDDIKHRLSMRIAELSREDMQRENSCDNSDIIKQLGTIEGVLKNPETYDVMIYPQHTIIDHLKKHDVINDIEAITLRHKLRGEGKKLPPFQPHT